MTRKFFLISLLSPLLEKFIPAKWLVLQPKSIGDKLYTYNLVDGTGSETKVVQATIGQYSDYLNHSTMLNDDFGTPVSSYRLGKDGPVVYVYPTGLDS